MLNSNIWRVERLVDENSKSLQHPEGGKIKFAFKI